MTKLEKYMLNNGILTKKYLSDEEVKQSGKQYDSEIITESKPVVKFYKMEEWKVYLDEKYDENKLPEGVFKETINEPIDVKKYFKLIYTGDMTKQEEIKLITEMKKGKLFTALTAYIYTALILTFIGLFIGIITLL